MFFQVNDLVWSSRFNLYRSFFIRSGNNRINEPILAEIRIFLFKLK